MPSFGKSKRKEAVECPVDLQSISLSTCSDKDDMGVCIEWYTEWILKQNDTYIMYKVYINENPWTTSARKEKRDHAEQLVQTRNEKKEEKKKEE